MASNSKRPGIPSWDEINNASKPANSPKRLEEWAEEVIGSKEQPDTDFEVDSTPVMSVTGSTNPTKPRTVKAGYDYTAEKLVVVFRDGTWWEYRGVPVDMWNEFKSAESKGKYLRESGLDAWPDMGPVDVSAMPRSQRVLMNDLEEFLNYMYLRGRNK